MGYGTMEPAAAIRVSSLSVYRTALITAAACAFCVIATIAVVDLANQNETITSLAWVPDQRVLVRAPVSGAEMLYDAALDPLYNGGADPIEPYKWLGANSAGYDAEAQNPLADLPMTRAEITDPDDEFWGQAPHDMSKSCDKTASCVDEENVLDYLPNEEVQTLKNRIPSMEPEENVWANNPLDY